MIPGGWIPVVRNVSRPIQCPTLRANCTVNYVWPLGDNDMSMSGPDL